MTIPEAHEQLESLTAKLTSCETHLQRIQLESQIARCYRMIQRAQQRAHRSLVTVADILLDLANEIPLSPLQSEALSLSAELIHRATTEQLAVAVPAAISDHGTNAPLPRIEGFYEINNILQGLHNSSRSFEHRLAVRTTLNLFLIVEKSQIRQVARQFSANLSNSQPYDAHAEMPTTARSQVA